MNLDIKKVALVIIDMQNGGCKPGGSLVEMIGVKEPRSELVYEPINNLKNWAYEKEVPVIYFQTIFEPDFSNAGLTGEKFPIAKFGHFARGSWDAEIVDELKMTDKDTLLTKVKWSAFFETNFEQYLKENDIEQLILCGGATDVCVLETATDAFFRNIECFVPKQSTYSFFKEAEEIGFKMMEFGRATVCDIDDVLNI